MPRESLSQDEARRVALAAAGLDRPRPQRVTANTIARVIRRLGLLQLDFVNALVPAHYLVLFSRLGAYDRHLFRRVAYESGQFTEQWAHEASLIPIETWPLLRHRMAEHRPRPYPFATYIHENPEHVAWALAQVRERGPLTAAGIVQGKAVSLGAESWFTTVERALLEAHFGFGRLAVTSRSDRFVRSYDLAERALPSEIISRQMDRIDAERELVRIAARACGIASAADLADYFRTPVKPTHGRIAELVDSGELLACDVEGWRVPGYLHRDASLPRSVSAISLLSPFDPLIWRRDRVARLFDFDYRIEIFVPSAKRRWGYYVLPFLLNDRLVARLDLRANRAANSLQVLGAWREKKVGKIGNELRGELDCLARWLDLERVTFPGGLPWLSTS
jgi:uncharacterized protein YcaQ